MTHLGGRACVGWRGFDEEVLVRAILLRCWTCSGAAQGDAHIAGPFAMVSRQCLGLTTREEPGI